MAGDSIFQYKFLEEKIGLFRNAEFVIGPIGGGLANVLFCRPDTKVISINSPEFFPIKSLLKEPFYGDKPANT